MAIINQMVNTGHRSEEFSTCRMFVAISFNILQRSSTFLLQRKRFMRCSLPNRSHSSCGLVDLLSSVTGPRKKVVENGEVRSWAKGFLWIARIFYAVKEEEEEEEVLVSPCFTINTQLFCFFSSNQHWHHWHWQSRASEYRDSGRNGTSCWVPSWWLSVLAFPGPCGAENMFVLGGRHGMQVWHARRFRGELFRHIK